MPKLYEYFGLMVLFYSNEHEPVHVHGKCEARECRAEILLVNGAVTGIRYTRVSGRNPLTPREIQYFEELVTARCDEIVRKWIDYFVLNKPVKSERITRRLK